MPAAKLLPLLAAVLVTGCGLSKAEFMQGHAGVRRRLGVPRGQRQLPV